MHEEQPGLIIPPAAAVHDTFSCSGHYHCLLLIIILQGEGED